MSNAAMLSRRIWISVAVGGCQSRYYTPQMLKLDLVVSEVEKRLVERWAQEQDFKQNLTIFRVHATQLSFTTVVLGKNESWELPQGSFKMVLLFIGLLLLQTLKSFVGIGQNIDESCDSFPSVRGWICRRHLALTVMEEDGRVRKYLELREKKSAKNDVARQWAEKCGAPVLAVTKLSSMQCAVGNNKGFSMEEQAQETLLTISDCSKSCYRSSCFLPG